MPTVQYHYPRALELEGRHPSDAGCWGVTVHRLLVGEGLPYDGTPWALVTFPEGEPIPLSRRPPPEVLRWTFFYRRIRSSAECERHLLLNPQAQVRPAFQLTAGWANPPHGMIPLPSDVDPPIPHSHAATFIGCIPDRRLFHFRLLWKDWGDRGTGYMPYEYFDRYVFECWATYGNSGLLKQYKLKRLDEDGRMRWAARDEEDHHIYAYEVRDPRLDERQRHAWTFVIERDGALEIEEMYVRPEYRGLGHGRWLAERVAQLAREKGMPLRLWVGFADCKAESESNYAALVATARRLGVRFQPCAVPWAAYFGTTEQPGDAFPVEPATIPGRPRMPLRELLAYVLALGLGPIEPGASVAPPALAHQIQEVRETKANQIDDTGRDSRSDDSGSGNTQNREYVPTAADEAEILEDAGRIRLPPRDSRLIVAHIVPMPRRVPRLDADSEE